MVGVFLVYTTGHNGIQDDAIYNLLLENYMYILNMLAINFMTIDFLCDIHVIIYIMVVYIKIKYFSK